MKRSLRALQHQTYLFVWIGSLLSNIGNWMENVGQGWVIASQTHSSFYVEMLSFAQFLPVIFLSIPAGIIADHFNRKYVLITTQATMCFVATGLTFFAFRGRATPELIVAAALMQGAVWAVNGPAWQTVLPFLVPRKDLESAIALNSIQYNLARLIGPAIAGFIVFRWGVPWAFGLNALSFLAVILALSIVPFTSSASKNTHAPTPFAVAWKWTWGHTGSRRLIISIASFAVFSAPLQGLMPIFASDVFQIGPKGLGTLLSCMGAGAVFGAFMLGFLPEFYPRHHLIPLSIIFLGLFSTAYGQAQSPLAAYVLLFLVGIFWLSTMVSCNTAMQLLVPDKIRGRAMSILLLAHVGLLPVGHLLGGFLANSFGPRLTLMVMSLGLTLIGTVTVLDRVPEIDGFTPKPRSGRKNFFSEFIFASSHRAEALSLDRSAEDQNL